MATRVGNCRFQRLTFSIATRRFCIDGRAKTTPSGPSLRKSWSVCDEGRRYRDSVSPDQRDHREPLRARRDVTHRGPGVIGRDDSWGSGWFDSKALAAEHLVAARVLRLQISAR